MHNSTPLCELAMKYGADKCPQICHWYTPFYYEYLKDRRYSIKKILEVGVGNHRQRKLIPNYFIGASLRMWRDFFPNAWVYGADISPDSMFEDERISTHYCNEQKEEDILALLEKTGTDIDFVVDDASHHFTDQLFLVKTMMPHLKKDVIFFSEDNHRTRMMRKMLPEYDCFIPKFPPNERPRIHDGIVVIKNK